MVHVYANSCRGYAHLKSGKPCQDYTLSYQDGERTIIACCDGHGGERYVRSQSGSKFAAEAVFTVFKKLTPRFLAKYKGKEAEGRIRMELLCAWNKLVEEDLAAHRLRKKELDGLDEEQREALLRNPIKAYGTTMTGALLLGSTLVIAKIGDTECLLLHQGKVERPLEKEDDPAGNITYSLCQDDAYEYIRAKVLSFRGYEGVILCTDGFSGPFQSYDNLFASFLKPLVKKASAGKESSFAESYVVELAKEKGSGDDVSLAYLLDGQVNLRHYK